MGLKKIKIIKSLLKEIYHEKKTIIGFAFIQFI